MIRKTSFLAIFSSFLWTACVAENSMTGDPLDPGGDQVCQDGNDCCKAEELVCRGNIDGTTVCSCYKAWSCDDALNPKKCTQKPADTPDGKSNWICQVYMGMERCVRTGGDVPQGKNGWSCAKDSSGVQCQRPLNTPDGAGGWGCSYAGDVKVCLKGPPPTKVDSGVPPKTDSKVPPPKKDSGVPPKTDSKVPPKTDTGVPPKQDTGVPPTGWNCYKDATGANVCHKDDSGYPPGGGAWKCYWKNGTVTCEGSSPTPPGGGGWNCTSNELVGGFRCVKPYTPGDTPGGGGQWNCTSGTDQKGTTCVQQPPPPAGKLCIPGQKRWCDGKLYCGYGQQICLPSGVWDPNCVELPGGQRPNTVCACYFFYFNKDCCETPDCLVPPNQPNGQICPASKGNYCDYCNPQNPECKGAGAKCVVTPKSETFCGEDCTGGKPCPVGAMCTPVQSGGKNYWQCIPADQSCYY
jgi:hypothetical protein